MENPTRLDSNLRSKHLAVAYLTALTAASFASAQVQREASVPIDRRHYEFASMAAEIIHGHPETLASAQKPKFFVCGARHLHWRRGSTGIYAESYAMQQRLEMEWFWKHLSRDQRQFWRPYFSQLNSLIDNSLQISISRQLTPDEHLQYRLAADKIIRAGVSEYARRNQLQLVDENPDTQCCASAVAQVILTSTHKNVIAIKWLEAGTVWLGVESGREPEYFTYAPGVSIEVAPGGMYYYKLVLRDGRESRRLLATVPNNGARLILAWR